MKRQISEYFHYDRPQVFDAVTRVENWPVVDGVQISATTGEQLAPDSTVTVSLEVASFCLSLSLQVVEFVENEQFALYGQSRLGRAALGIRLADDCREGTLVDYEFDVRARSRLARLAEVSLRGMALESGQEASSQHRKRIDLYLARTASSA